MSSEKEGINFMKKYGIDNAKIISDKKRKLYKEFGLVKGSISQIINRSTIARKKEASAKGFKITMPKGSVLQMPGVFLINNGEIVKEFRHTNAGEIPDYEELSTCPLTK